MPHSHSHGLDDGSLPMLPGTLDVLGGEDQFTYNPGPAPIKDTLNKIERYRADLTLSDIWRYEYNTGPNPPANTISVVFHDSYDTDGSTLIVTKTYTHTYLASPPFGRLQKVRVS